ncbi:MAG: class I SAM-dependent methyltransferase [Anaerolineae bacterium]|nr:class I SAM-dependent methyltransferase [Anaerolineae bacterium]
MKYQTDYSQHFPATTDRAKRTLKLQKVLRVLEDFLGHSLTGLRVLDMGCSIGVMTGYLAESAHLAVGIDIDQGAIRQAAQNGPQASLVIGDTGGAPFAPSTFDIIVCSQVYEHVPSLELLVAEMDRLLKQDGVCFFSGPNRWRLIEPHYKLPFLSWLPRRAADWYVRLTGLGQEYYERPLSAKGLRRALYPFVIHDYTLRLLTEPARFAMEKEVGHLRYMPAWGWRILYPWLPNFNWILTKRA